MALRAYVRPVGVHRTCGEPNEIKENTHLKNITLFFVVRRAGRRRASAVLGTAGTCKISAAETAGTAETAGPGSDGCRISDQIGGQEGGASTPADGVGEHDCDHDIKQTARCGQHTHKA